MWLRRFSIEVWIGRIGGVSAIHNGSLIMYNNRQNLRTQIATSKHGGTRHLPFAFTEQGVAMLASVLNSSKAIEINIQIVRSFVFLRQYNLSH